MQQSYYLKDMPPITEIKCGWCASGSGVTNVQLVPLKSINGVPCEPMTSLRLSEKLCKELMALAEKAK